MRAYIGLGSNLGDRRTHIDKALSRLESLLTDFAVSEAVETEALDRDGKIDSRSPPYLNTVIRGDCDLDPRTLFEKIIAIETELGRPPGEKSRYLPRTIDIDLLVLEDRGRPVVVNDPDLIVPHPRLGQRPFLEDAIKKLCASGARKPPRSR